MKSRNSSESSDHDQHPLDDVSHLPKHRRHSLRLPSKIDFHHFDPLGIEHLRRSLSKHGEKAGGLPPEFVVDESFDLARTLQYYMDK